MSYANLPVDENILSYGHWKYYVLLYIKPLVVQTKHALPFLIHEKCSSFIPLCKMYVKLWNQTQNVLDYPAVFHFHNSLLQSMDLVIEETFARTDRKSTRLNSSH